MPYIEFEGTKLYFESSGKGTPLVLLHGFLENLEMWRQWVPLLSANYQVVCIDLCGHGKSGVFSSSPSINTMAAAVRAVLNSISVSNYLLVGHSMGGYVALQLLEKWPEEVIGLCLFHSTAMADTDEKKLNRDRAMKVVRANKQTFISAAIPLLFSGLNRERCNTEMEWAVKQAQTTNKKGVLYCLSAMKLRSDATSLILKHREKVCYLLGDNDSVLPMPVMMPEIEQLKKENVVILKDCGHMSHLESPEEAFKELSRLIGILALRA